jgi:carbon-monoxide dehydrogenase large subunit
MTDPVLPKLIGQPVKRWQEDPRLITGTGTYTDDVRLSGMLHLAVLRSSVAHARIRRLDVDEARRHPGVVAVFTGADTAHIDLPFVCAAMVPDPDLKLPARHPLAVGKVRYVGEPVAAVVATGPYAAKDALAGIDVDYDTLPAVVDPEQALADGAPVIHDEFSDNVAYRARLVLGEVDAAFAAADVVVRRRLLNTRLFPFAMEPRAVVAAYEPGRGKVSVWSTTQMPHVIRTYRAPLLGLPENRIRMSAPDVGGGFGSKIDVHGDEVLVPWAAMRLGRPVKYVEERSENLVQTIHGRGQVDYVEVAATREGTVTGLRLKIIADLGAYHSLVGAGVPPITVAMAQGCYDVTNLEIEIYGVFTNKTSTGAYRGAGRPEATYALERAMDLLAGELGLDPVEVRRRNFIPSTAFPYTTCTEITYDSGDYEKALAKAVELVGYEDFRKEQGRARQDGRYLGIGVSAYVEICGWGPSAALPWGGWESATVRIDPSGHVTLLTGTSPHGQGGATTLAQIVADGLDVPIEGIVVSYGDTDTVPYGLGTYGSRTVAVGGSAVVSAVGKVIAKARKIAGHMLEACEADIEFVDGRFQVKGVPARGVTLAEVAQKAHVPVGLPSEIEPGLEARSSYEPPNFTAPFGTHVAIVEVDPETGAVSVLRYLAVDDVGRVINPLLLDGQVHGGVAQGIGQSLYEEVVYDENGQLVTGSLMDYAVPKAAHVPSIETATTETLTPVNPLGAKGIGEAPSVASPAAIVNAVMDALTPFGIRHLDMPLRPEKIWRAMQESRTQPGRRA